MYDPVMISYGKGNLPAYLADPSLHTDIVSIISIWMFLSIKFNLSQLIIVNVDVQVPVDMVVNTAIAAIAKHGITSKPQLNVYHVATDYVNPLRFSDMFDYIYQHFSDNPLTHHSQSVTKMTFFHQFSDFSNYVRDALIASQPNPINHKLYKAKVAYAEQLCKMYEFIGFFKARYD